MGGPLNPDRTSRSSGILQAATVRFAGAPVPSLVGQSKASRENSANRMIAQISDASYWLPSKRCVAQSSCGSNFRCCPSVVYQQSEHQCFFITHGGKAGLTINGSA